jgi:hypothetical protein
MAEQDPNSLLEMSDEDFLKADPPETEPIAEPVVPAVEPPTDPPEEEPVVPLVEADPEVEDESTKTEPVAKPDKADPPKEEKVPEVTIDYKAEYEKLLKPFKANGIDIQVKDADEAITLMQMGANYHKKMASLKPALKTVKLLERHDLLDESKLGFLIDLSKKDPAAIQKLLKDSKIDPLDIDVASESNYAPKVTPVSDVEMQLDDVLSSIESTPTYARTLQVVTNDWDAPSRTAAATNPQIIRVINEHIGSGIYDKVMNEVNRAQALGKLQGMSTFDAYKHVGDILSNQGLLTPKVVTPGPTDADKKAAEDKRSAQRKAAGSPPVKKGAAPEQPKSGLLGMSDEEFMKLPAAPYTKA